MTKLEKIAIEKMAVREREKERFKELVKVDDILDDFLGGV